MALYEVTVEAPDRDGSATIVVEADNAPLAKSAGRVQIAEIDGRFPIGLRCIVSSRRI